MAMTGVPRTGVGVDVHASRRCPTASCGWPGCCGPTSRGSRATRDADVACHAACDALFSAAGIGDLGMHFGTDRPEYAGASGRTLLAEAARLVREAGFEIGNVAIQVIGNRPKIGAQRRLAEQAMSAAARASVSVGGTTTDGLGLTGRGEGDRGHRHGARRPPRLTPRQPPPPPGFIRSTTTAPSTETANRRSTPCHRP